MEGNFYPLFLGRIIRSINLRTLSIEIREDILPLYEKALSDRDGEIKIRKEEIELVCIANLPDNKKSFLICTYGGSEAHKSMESIIQSKRGTVIGKYDCKGYDTFGPFKLVGGVAKGHPTEEEIFGAISFYEKILKA